MKNILVTGGAGFIGSEFVRGLASKNAHFIVNLDALTYAGNLQNLASVIDNPKHHFVKGDIRDSRLVAWLFEKHSIDTVVNFAAESHVDRSIENPGVFLETNILGTQTLMDAAKSLWKINPKDKHCRRYRPGVKFLQVSTDEVYGSLGSEGYFTEDTPLSPNSPYAASKAAADMLVHAYSHTYGLPVNITRCSNNYGPYQFPEKLIPLMINNATQDKPLPVYGDGLQVRDWLFVKDHCDAIETVLQRGEAGEVYNIGGNCEKTNIDIVKTILAHLGKPQSLIAYVKDRPGHDRRYAIDNAKIKIRLGWEPVHRFDDALALTIKWYLENKTWLDGITSGEYSRYYAQMYPNAK